MYISKKKHVYTRQSDTNDREQIQSTDSTYTIGVMAEDKTTEQEMQREKMQSAVEGENNDFAGQSPDEMIGATEKEDISDAQDIYVEDDPQVLDTEDMNDMAALTLTEFKAENTDEGILKIRASSGGGSIPLANVNIVVYKDLADGRHTFFAGVTNADGAVSDIKLPAPPKINSEIGNGASPYASYTVSATRDGLRRETVENVPVFSGIKSIQPIDMQSVGEV